MTRFRAQLLLATDISSRTAPRWPSASSTTPRRTATRAPVGSRR